MLIIVTGPSGVGKTTLAQNLSNSFNIPVIHKDAIKELLFDTLGCKDLAWSKELGIASWKIFDHLIHQHISKGQQLIIESNFKPKHDQEKFKKWQDKYNFPIIQIMCTAKPEVILERFKNRSKQDRHPGHNDHLISDESLKEGIELESFPMDLNCEIIDIDMSDFKNVCYKEIEENIETIINKLSA